MVELAEPHTNGQISAAIWSAQHPHRLDPADPTLGKQLKPARRAIGREFLKRAPHDRATARIEQIRRGRADGNNALRRHGEDEGWKLLARTMSIDSRSRGLSSLPVGSVATGGSDKLATVSAR